MSLCRQVPFTQLVPAALDHPLAAGRAIGAVALRIVDVADIDIVQPGIVIDDPDCQNPDGCDFSLFRFDAYGGTGTQYTSANGYGYTGFRVITPPPPPNGVPVPAPLLLIGAGLLMLMRPANRRP